jgi:hypothetical protein
MAMVHMKSSMLKAMPSETLTCLCISCHEDGSGVLGACIPVMQPVPADECAVYCRAVT